jgi:hypothetical protein
MSEAVDLQKVREEVAIAALRRKDRLAAFNQYAEVLTSKLFGITSLTIGILDLLQPTAFAITAQQAEGGIGLGLALLVGPRVLTIIGKVSKALQ